MSELAADYDSPWKQALEAFFGEFMVFFFPAAHADIDWSNVMAHLKAQETRRDPTGRQAWKLWLTRRLYKLGYERQRILDLFRFIDWVLQLPEPQELAFWREVSEMEEGKRMQYVTSVERLGIQQGLQQGEAAMVLRLLSR